MSFLRRLYRGETNLDFIGNRKRWYLISAVLLVVCIGSMAIRQFNWGIEFAGGNEYMARARAGVSLEAVRGAVEGTGIEVASAQVLGGGEGRKYVIRTAEANEKQSRAIETAIAHELKIPTNRIEDEIDARSVSSSWGKSVTRKALFALVVFLLAVGAYLWIRFEQKMAYAALAALGHDLLLTAGVYSLVGFEVTPGTVIGLLTILGYSLYDTVVVFDKVEENTRGILGHNRFSFAKAANTAVNQTLMRSINTSLVALLPVGGLLFVGAGILGVGTLKDLALVLFVGMLTGAYSSLFLATPWLVEFKMLDPRYKMHAQRVAARRSSVAAGQDPKEGRSARARAAAGRSATRETPVAAGAGKGAPKASTAKSGAAKSGAAKGREPADRTGDEVEAGTAAGGAGARAGAAPRPGARAGQRKRQGGRRR